MLRRGGGRSGTMEASMSEAVSQAVSKAEQSYTKKSRFVSIGFWSDLMVLFNSSTLSCWITVLSLRVNIEMRWSGGGWGRLARVDGVELDSSMFSSSSRLRTWLVGVGHIMHPCILQGLFLVHLWASWWGVSGGRSMRVSSWRGVVGFILRLSWIFDTSGRSKFCR